MTCGFLSESKGKKTKKKSYHIKKTQTNATFPPIHVSYTHRETSGKKTGLYWKASQQDIYFTTKGSVDTHTRGHLQHSLKQYPTAQLLLRKLSSSSTAVAIPAPLWQVPLFRNHTATHRNNNCCLFMLQLFVCESVSVCESSSSTVGCLCNQSWI